jgi:hypothetical protein
MSTRKSFAGENKICNMAFMEIETNIPAPRPKGEIIDILRELEPNQSVRFPAHFSPPESVRTTVSRLRSEFNGSRAFVTATEGDGVRVWRTA